MAQKTLFSTRSTGNGIYEVRFGGIFLGRMEKINKQEYRPILSGRPEAMTRQEALRALKDNYKPKQVVAA